MRIIPDDSEEMVKFGVSQNTKKGPVGLSFGDSHPYTYVREALYAPISRRTRINDRDTHFDHVLSTDSTGLQG
jgi:hypothetical protein